ncbi:MAG: TIGR01777 family oxidoreductase [Actinomycetota bacterium]
MDVAITGASGLIGGSLADALGQDGHRVVRLVRPQTRGSEGDKVRWDPVGGTIEADGLEGLDAVVHLAGAGIGDTRWTRAHKQEIMRSRAEGTALLASALGRLQRPPTVFVCGTATGFYGDGGERELTEEAPAGEGFRAEVCRAWEAAALPVTDAGVRLVLLRTANVLSTNGGLLPFLLTPFKLGLGARFGDGRQWFPWITLEDEVAAIRFAITNGRLRGPVNAAAPAAVTNAAFAKTLGRVLRRPAPWWAPGPVLRVIAGKERADEALLSSAKVVPAVLQDAGFGFGDPEVEPALRRILARSPEERPRSVRRDG